MSEHTSGTAHSHHPDPGAAPPGTVKDPVCGMNVDPLKTPHHAEHAGQDYHFCGAGCRTKLIADRAKYLNPRAPLHARG